MGAAGTAGAPALNFDVAVNGRSWKIGIQPAGRPGLFTISVKGRERVVDAAWIDQDTLSLIDGSAVREVRIDKRDAGAVTLTIAGRKFDAVFPGTGRMHSSDPPAGTRPADPLPGPQPVRAPMPGRVVRVLVSVGDRVSARQGLMVVEAMKMENELRSPKEGVVTMVGASAGAVVEAGAVLVVIAD